MVKDMYKKREERKLNKTSNTELENKTNINWLITINLNL